MQPRNVQKSGSIVNEVVTFTPTSPLSMNVSMRLNDDMIGLEGNEVYELWLVERDIRVPVGNSKLKLYTRTRITIKDDDGLSVCLSVCLLVL